MVHNSRIRGNVERPKAFWGTFIPAALNFVGGLITNSQQAKAQKRMMEEQQRLAQQQLNISNQNNLAATINNSVDAQNSYDNEDYYNLKYRNGGTRRLGSNGITITDGGNAKRIGNNTFLLQGGSHEDVNETGQTGIGINVGGNEIEAEGGEVAQKKGNSLRIFSAQPMLNNDISPAQAVVNGANKDKVFAAQQRFKRNNHLNDDGGKFDNGGSSKKTVHFYKSKSGRVFRNYNEALYDNKLWNNDIVYRYNRKGDLYHQKYGLREHTIPFQKQNAITLRNAGRASGAIISPNQLDSIAKYANRAGLSIPTAFGMVMKESTFNNPTDTKSAAILFGLKKGSKEYNKWITGTHFQGNGNRLDKGNAREFINFHKDDSLNPYWQDMRYVENQTRNINKAKEMLLNGERNADRRAKSSPKLTGGKKLNVMEAAFKDYKTNPYGYNPGQKDYVPLVNQNAKDIMNSPQIQQWYKTSPYAKGRRYKCGGRIKAENGMKLSLDDSYVKHDLLYQLTKNHPTARKIVDEVFGSESDRRRFVEDLQRFGYGSEDASSIAGASPIFRQPIVSAAKQSQFIKNTNNVRKGVTSTAPFTAEHFVNKTKDLGNSLTSILHEIGNKLGTNINKTPITRTPSAIELNIYNGAKNMTNGANPFLYTPRNAMKISKPNIKVPKVNGKTLGKITGYSAAALAPTIGAYFVSKRNDNKNETVNNQLDAKGQPISPYIARPKNTISNKSVKKDSTSSIPDSIRRPQSKKDSVITDTIKQTKPVIQQKTSTPKYKSNVTKGNYRLHDGESKVINGTRYSRVGNNIINHKTNVAYIYDKNGNYTGQADYSKVGKNFNDAFDAARAAGRTNFIYRAGKYNRYSTAKESDAKKEALNRKVGAKRIAKRMGGLTNPPVERKKYVNGGNSNHWDKYKVPNYGGVAPWQISNMYDVTIPYAITEQDLPIVSVSAPKNVSNNPIIKNVGIETKKTTNNSIVPYLGRQSSFKPAAQDYIGLGIDTLAALGSGMFARRAYDNLNFDYKLPSYVDESPVAFDTTYHNESQRANVERNRINGRNLIQGNTASAQTSLSRMQQGDVNAMMELNKLADEKANKEVELRNQNAANEQQVRARNAAARNQYYQNVAQIQNAAIEARNNAALAKAQSIGADFSGLSQAWSNFAGSVENRYNANQNQIAIMAQAENPSVVQNAITMGYDLSPQVLANLYRSTNNEDLRKAILGRISYKDRNRYGLN